MCNEDPYSEQVKGNSEEARAPLEMSNPQGETCKKEINFEDAPPREVRLEN